MAVAPHTYISRTLALFNWHTQPTTSSELYPRVDIKAFACKVDLVLLSSEPYHFREGHVSEVVAAVDGAEVALIDGEMTSGMAAARSKGFATWPSTRGGLIPRTARFKRLVCQAA